MKHGDFKLSFCAKGDRYRPTQVRFEFTSQHDTGDPATRGKYMGGVYPYGSSKIQVPDGIPRTEMVAHLVACVQPLLPAMTQAGADSFHVDVAYYFDGQCNMEFNPNELALLTSLGCDLTLSCYQIDEAGNCT